jgi:hypothetical protein
MVFTMSVFLLCGAGKCFSTVVVLSGAWYLFSCVLVLFVFLFYRVYFMIF